MIYSFKIIVQDYLFNTLQDEAVSGCSMCCWYAEVSLVCGLYQVRIEKPVFDYLCGWKYPFVICLICNI